MKAYWWSRSMAPRILYLGTKWRWVVSFTPRPFYYQEKSPWYPVDRRLGGLGVVYLDNWKINCVDGYKCISSVRVFPWGTETEFLHISGFLIVRFGVDFRTRRVDVLNSCYMAYDRETRCMSEATNIYQRLTWRPLDHIRFSPWFGKAVQRNVPTETLNVLQHSRNGTCLLTTSHAIYNTDLLEDL
jgi:hypothetical protein